MRYPVALTLILGLVGCPSPKDEAEPTDSDVTDLTDTDEPTDDADVTDEPTDTDEPTPDLWEWCPTADGGAADPAQPVATGAQLTVTEDALWCAMSREFDTLEEAAQRRVQLRVIQGTYQLPFEAPVADQAFDLPVCAQSWGDGPHPAGDGSATLGYSRSTNFGYDSASWSITAPLDADGAAWTLELTAAIEAEGSLPDLVEFTMGDRDPSMDFTSGVLRASLIEGSDPTDFDKGRAMAPCAFLGPDTQTHELSFDGGNIELDIRIGESMASTEPAMFVAARGSYGGEAFDVTDYFSLVYRPDHHHFGRHFAVWFPTPQGEVCGLRVEDVDPYYGPGGVLATVREMGCDMTPGRTLAVTSQALSR
jgi:hypothetical protein